MMTQALPNDKRLEVVKQLLASDTLGGENAKLVDLHERNNVNRNSNKGKRLLDGDAPSTPAPPQSKRFRYLCAAANTVR